MAKLSEPPRKLHMNNSNFKPILPTVDVTLLGKLPMHMASQAISAHNLWMHAK